MEFFLGVLSSLFANINRLLGVMVKLELVGFRRTILFILLNLRCIRYKCT